MCSPSPGEKSGMHEDPSPGGSRHCSHMAFSVMEGVASPGRLFTGPAEHKVRLR